MSASSKKKLRAAERAEQLTERQLAEKKEAKNLKILTIVVVAALVLMIVAAAGTVINSRFIQPAKLEKEAQAIRDTVAVTVGEHDVNAVEYNCFYVDAVSQFYNQVGTYASLYGLDVTKPLDEQTYDEEAGTTWADYFKTSAESSIKSVYAITDEAKANGFELSEDEQTYIDNQMASMAVYAANYGYPNVDTYLAAMYGTGANEETVRAYFERCYTADAYQQSVAEGLEYTDADIRAKDNEDPSAYTFYSYNSYYLNTSKFLQGGTEDEEGNKTYSDEEKAAAVKDAEAAAQLLTAEGITSVEALDAAIKALPINAESESAASQVYTDNSYGYIASPIQNWVTDAARQNGDLTYLPSTTTAEDGTETINGYYVVYFLGCNTNEVKLQNVRHILCAFEGGTTDGSGNKTYSETEKAKAKEAAEALLNEWKSGKATEDSFAALAKDNTDDGNGAVGGLYENVYPGQMVATFNDWLFDAGRMPGDTDIVETSFGYHVMYYVGAAEQTYRDMMIENTLVNEDVTAWHEALVKDLTVEVKNVDNAPTGMILNSGSAY